MQPIDAFAPQPNDLPTVPMCGTVVPGRCLVDRRKASMASKDKGGRSAKTPASKSAKEKKQSKRDKKASKSNSAITS